MAHDVFVSYSTSDKPIADAVCATLERSGVRCWIAPRDILPGLDWGAAIVDAIGASRVMVLVFSASANKSPQIKREVERAVHKGVTIIPLRIEDVPLGKTLEYFISSSHWLDAFTPSVEAHLDRLAETVKVLLARTSRGSTTGVSPPRRDVPPPPPPPLAPKPAAPIPPPPSVAPERPATFPPAAAVPAARGTSPRVLAVVAGAALAVGLGALLATRGHSPRIESIQFPPALVAGQRGTGVIHFTDKKGDAALVKFDVLQGRSFQPWTMELTGMNGKSSGDYGFWLMAPIVERVELQATIVDNDGRKSNSVRFGFDVQPAPVRAPAQPRKKAFEIQAPNGFKFKVN
jgi:hypothetical protein